MDWADQRREWLNKLLLSSYQRIAASRALLEETAPMVTEDTGLYIQGGAERRRRAGRAR